MRLAEKDGLAYLLEAWKRFPQRLEPVHEACRWLGSARPLSKPLTPSAATGAKPPSIPPAFSFFQTCTIISCSSSTASPPTGSVKKPSATRVPEPSRQAVAQDHRRSRQAEHGVRPEKNGAATATSDAGDRAVVVAPPSGSSRNDPPSDSPPMRITSSRMSPVRYAGPRRRGDRRLLGPPAVQAATAEDATLAAVPFVRPCLRRRLFHARGSEHPVLARQSEPGSRHEHRERALHVRGHGRKGLRRNDGIGVAAGSTSASATGPS